MQTGAMVRLCKKPNDEGDSRTCFQIHHECCTTGNYPVLMCGKVESQSTSDSDTSDSDDDQDSIDENS